MEAALSAARGDEGTALALRWFLRKAPRGCVSCWHGGLVWGEGGSLGGWVGGWIGGCAGGWVSVWFFLLNWGCLWQCLTATLERLGVAVVVGGVLANIGNCGLWHHLPPTTPFFPEVTVTATTIQGARWCGSGLQKACSRGSLMSRKI